MQSTSGTTCLVADRALSRAAKRPKLAETRTQWLTRVPATVREAQAVVAPADPQTRAPLTEAERAPEGRARSGGVAHRWGRLPSAPRQPQAPRTVDKQGLKHRAHDVTAFQTLCRTAFACAADASQALARVTPTLQTAFLPPSTVCPRPRDGKRGRPSPHAQPEQIVSHSTGALASRLTDRQARVDQQRGGILATNALAEGQLSAQAVLDGAKGQGQAERGVRFMQDPQFVASSLSLKKPERLMALLLVMTVCLRVYAALE